MKNGPTKNYGDGREQRNVSYAEVERTAIAILKSERRPTIETVREALGRGSPATLGDALKRFWRDLGCRIEGDAAALSRLPSEIAELADGLWQRALFLSGEAAVQEDNAARQRLSHIQLENELKEKSLALREAEWDISARARERAIAEAQQHLLLTLKALNREQALLQARDARIADLELLLQQYRDRIEGLVAGATNRATKRLKVATSGQSRAATKRKITPKKVKRSHRATRRLPPTSRSKARSKSSLR